jgi:hypothetical protein
MVVYGLYLFLMLLVESKEKLKELRERFEDVKLSWNPLPLKGNWRR